MESDRKSNTSTSSKVSKVSISSKSKPSLNRAKTVSSPSLARILTPAHRPPPPPKKVSPKTTKLPCGEKLLKTNKLFTTIGAIEEVIGGLAKINHTYFSDDSKSPFNNMFVYTRISQIIDDLQLIIKSITTTPVEPDKYQESRFSLKKLQELEGAVERMPDSRFINPQLHSVIEADIYLIRTTTKRCERALLKYKDTKLNIVIEDTVLAYISKVVEYLGIMVMCVAGIKR